MFFVKYSNTNQYSKPYFSESDSSESQDDELDLFSTVTYREESNIVSIDQELEEMLGNCKLFPKLKKAIF